MYVREERRRLPKIGRSVEPRTKTTHADVIECVQDTSAKRSIQRRESLSGKGTPTPFHPSLISDITEDAENSVRQTFWAKLAAAVQRVSNGCGGA
jgi:hypothetical protein